MQVTKHFPFTGRSASWQVPANVTQALFEAWGAAGGVASLLHQGGKPRQVVGGTGARNAYFYNSPAHETQLGASYANCAGYASGVATVAEGETYNVYVGGNGGPGHSTIRMNTDGSFTVGVAGGAGGWNGGGDGGRGALVSQNLFNSTSTKVDYKRSSLPPSAKSGQLWWDTSGSDLVKKCNTTYTAGHASDSKWTRVSAYHDDMVGPSGGGGGGATDIRKNGTDTSDRILVAGGSGGAAGKYDKSGVSAWNLVQFPADPSNDKVPNPPFGTDTTTATGPDKTWATGSNYLGGGWGRGGIGGGSTPLPGGSPTADGGTCSYGGSGGPGSGRAKQGAAPVVHAGSGGGGGTNDSGGSAGSGGSGGTAGGSGDGGRGQQAVPNDDDWCAGGGGGGGGYWGGGGGGEGFTLLGSHVTTHGGGGGGGSNYAAPVFGSNFLLAAGVRPPSSVGNSGTGANGLGGFARITYHMSPFVSWSAVPRAIAGGVDFSAGFTYQPADDSGAGIAFYSVGTGAETDTFPTSVTTVMVTDPTQTDFTRTFTAPADGDTEAIFVRVTDTDRDSSAWLKQTITGLGASAVSSVTLTAPSAGDQILDDTPATVTWTIGDQTPLAAYRIGLSGTDLVDGTDRSILSGWRRGGSRVNLALDPGFEGTAVWTTGDSTLTSEATNPGVSGKDAKVVWAYADDGSTRIESSTLDNLVPGTAYRLHLEIASALDYDVRPYEVQVWDSVGILANYVYDLSDSAAGGYVPADIVFTPQAQGVYFRVLPSATGSLGDDLVFLDFEDGTTGGFTGSGGVSDGTYSDSGDLSLKVSSGATPTLNLSSLLTGGGGYYIATAQVYAPAGSTGTLGLAGTGVTGAPFQTTSLVNGAWETLRLPFTWDGSGTVEITLAYSGTAAWFDDIDVSTVLTGWNQFGNTDSGQIGYLANMLVELVYEEDGPDGYGIYFDGSNDNGESGTVSWSGTTNASPSFLTGTDALSDTITYDDDPLSDGLLFVDTLTEGALVSGYDGSRASVAVSVNPSIPATPTVSVEFNSATGLVNFSIDAADGSADESTVSFDIFRNGTRIVTGLVPDETTRIAVYADDPGHAITSTYVVRAWDAGGGYADQPDGTVTTD